MTEVESVYDYSGKINSLKEGFAEFNGIIDLLAGERMSQEAMTQEIQGIIDAMGDNILLQEGTTEALSDRWNEFWKECVQIFPDDILKLGMSEIKLLFETRLRQTYMRLAREQHAQVKSFVSKVGEKVDASLDSGEGK